MQEKEFNIQEYEFQHKKRLVKIAIQSKKDRVQPHEYVRRNIRKALFTKDSRVQESDNFFVIGHDGYTNQLDTSGSFATIEEAKIFEKRKKEEEELFSSGDAISVTFYTFTKDGIRVNHVPGDDAQEFPIFQNPTDQEH